MQALLSTTNHDDDGTTTMTTMSTPAAGDCGGDDYDYNYHHLGHSAAQAAKVVAGTCHGSTDATATKHEHIMCVL